MENAARAVTKTAMEFLTGAGKKALILCGGGNNGGDGLAVARHLHNRGVDVSIGLTVAPEKYQGDALINWNIVRAMGLTVCLITPAAIAQSGADLIIDAIFGTGLQQAPRPPFGEIVAAIAARARPVLAVDLPSGMDCDTGEAPGDCIIASVTVTFVAEKMGFERPSSRALTGNVVVGDIGCPIELIASVKQI
jgi:NAD(P)H-hydrate epimerase